MEDVNLTLAYLRQRYSSLALQLLTDLGLGDLGQPMRSQLLSSFDNLISQRITQLILTNLDETAAKGIAKMVTSDEPEEATISYLIASTPGIKEKIEAGLADSYAEFIQEARELTQALTKHHPSTDEK